MLFRSYVLFGVIIAVFIFTFNTTSRLRSGSDVASSERMADVAGEDISQGELSLAMALSMDPPAPSDTGFQKLQASRRYESWRLPRSGPPGESLLLSTPAGYAARVYTALNAM